MFSGTVNQTGGANGAVRRFYDNSTLTAVADYTSFQTDVNTANAKGFRQTGANATNRFVGKTTFGATTTPTALVLVAAGTTAVPPVQQTSGTLNTTALAGAVEYNNSHYMTKNSGLRFALEGVIADSYADVSNTGTSETDIYTYTTPANTLAADGEKVKFRYILNLSDVTSQANIKVYFAGTSIMTTGNLNIASTGAMDISGYIVRTSSTTARAVVTIISPNTSIASLITETDLTSLTLSGTNILKITGTAGGGTGGSGDITGKMATVSWQAVAAN